LCHGLERWHVSTQGQASSGESLALLSHLLGHIRAAQALPALSRALMRLRAVDENSTTANGSASEAVHGYGLAREPA
jgi:hypothetical protein